MLNLRDVFKALTDIDTAALDVQISGAAIDSREIVDNNLFIALPGEHTDGHQYVAAAFHNGAIAALVDQDLHTDAQIIDLRPDHFSPGKITHSLPVCLRVEDTLNALQNIAAYWRKQHPTRTIGITGSVGKTSTKELTASLLSQKFNVLKNPGNRNNEIGLPLTLLDLNDDHDIAVLEMGFYVPGEIQTLCEIALPHIGVVTNIGTVHAERAGSQEVIARGKSELVQSLPSKPEGVAILNFDDPWVREMASQTQADVLSYGIKEPSDLTAVDIKTHGLQGLSCTLDYLGKRYPVQSPLLGEFSVYTILAAAAVAVTEGLGWEDIIKGLATSQVALRIHHFTLPNGALILDDTYNASPESTIAALKLLSSLDGRRVAILGDMLELGQYETSGHKSVGKFSAQSVDELILVGQRAKMIEQSAIQQGFSKEKIQWFENSDQAASAAAELVQNGDVVLVKGSNSMRMNRIIDRLKGSAR